MQQQPYGWIVPLVLAGLGLVGWGLKTWLRAELGRVWKRMDADRTASRLIGRDVDYLRRDVDGLMKRKPQAFIFRHGAPVPVDDDDEDQE